MCLPFPFSAGLLDSSVMKLLGFRSTWIPTKKNASRLNEHDGSSLAKCMQKGVVHSKELRLGEKVLDHVLCIIFKSPDLQEDKGVVVVVLNSWLFCASSSVGNFLQLADLAAAPPVIRKTMERHFLFCWNWGMIQFVPSMLWDLYYFCYWYLTSCFFFVVVVYVLFCFACRWGIFWLFLFCFQPKCIVNKLAFGLFVLIHVERKVIHFVQHLSLILTQAENKVANHFL